LTRKEDALTTVSDSTRDIWYTCGGCGLHAPLPHGITVCPGCGRPTRSPRKVPSDDEMLLIYTDTCGRIRAWLTMHGFADADRLTGIREVLADLDRARAGEAGGCR
jgi:hypothetical protein